MGWSGRGWLVGIVWVLGLALAPAANADSIVLPRPGQVGISGTFGYGSLLKGGVYGDDFSTGPSFGVRLRYRMRYERAIGLSFESQRFDVREPSAADTAFKTLSVMNSGVEFYQLFGTRTKTVRMLMVGAGISQPNVELNDGETFFYPGGDGFYVTGGMGLERFFYNSWAYDLSARYVSIFKDGKSNHEFQAAIGLIFYASY